MLAFSCNIDKEKDELFVDFFSVSGTVLDEAGNQPIQGITVQMDAYYLDDVNRDSPLLSYKCYTSSEGKYQFSVRSEENLLDVYFVFNLFDEFTFRDKKYESIEERSLFLSTGKGSFFNPVMNSYVVTGNDFLLSLSEN